jgi:predicted CxxxxCH...CXXCH cytochrome family protein
LTGTGQVSNNLKVGAHQTHLQYFNGYSNYSTVDYRCQTCHGTLPTSGNHASGSSVPAFQGLATRGGMAPAWTAATVTCSNTYCHNPAGSGILNAGNVGTRTFVSWTSSSYLADSAKNETNCNRCHKSPGTVAGTILLSGTSTHSTVKISDSCSGCHGHDGNNAGTIGKRHMDGIKYGGGGAGGCIGCHGYGVGSWAAASSINAEGKGAHEMHISYLTTKRFTVTLNATTDQYGIDTTGMGGTWTNVCGVCHTGGTHMDSTVNVAIAAAYLFGTGSPTYNGTPGQSSLTVPKTCSNISCHYFTTPLWSTY